MSIRLEVTIDDYHSQNRLGISARECDETETAPAYHPRLLPEGREVAPEFLLICLKTRSRIARFAHRNALDIRRLYLCACFRAKVHFAVEVAGEVAQQLVWLRSRNFLNAAFSNPHYPRTGWTMSITSRPSSIVAEWTWAIEPAATVSSSKPAETALDWSADRLFDQRSDCLKWKRRNPVVHFRQGRHCPVASQAVRPSLWGRGG